MSGSNLTHSVRRRWPVVEAAILVGAMGAPTVADPAPPVVAGFDRFHGEANEPSAAAGELLLGELNCVACHRPTDRVAKRLRIRRSPRLDRVGRRLSREALVRFIRRPAAVKSGTTMPGLFHEGTPDGRVGAIVEYLRSLADGDAGPPKRKPGDAARGRRLYHRVGCVACHAPEPGHRPAGVPDSVELKPPEGSVPIALAGLYEPAALADFLQDPLSVRPSGRMPDMHLADEAARDLAAYLRTRFGGEQGGPTAEDAGGADEGRRAFAAVGCANCHPTGDGVEPTLEAPPLGALPSAEVGCLAEKPPEGAPRYRLSDRQQAAIVAAVEGLGGNPPTDPAERVRRTLLSLDCYACHERGDRGGPTARRLPYFRPADARAEALGREARVPPALTDVGAKLRKAWLRKVFGGTGDVRPYLATRMPVFGKATDHLVDDFAAADEAANKGVRIDVSGAKAHHRGFIGRRLIGADKLNCISCHALRGHRSLGPPAVDLAHAPERLRPAYFKRLLLHPQEVNPGTTMPPLFKDGKSPVRAMLSGREPGKQIEQIWIYLREAEQMPLPKGMAEEHFVVTPEDRPVVARCFLKGVGTKAIAVGYPAKIHVAFDAKQVRWALRWRGAFLDMRGKWQDRFQPPLEPLGEEAHAWEEVGAFAILPSRDVPWPEETGRDAGYRFRGYRLGDGGVPTMRYRYKGLRVEDTLKPAKETGLIRIVKVRGRAENLWFRGLRGKRQPVGLDGGEATIRKKLQW